MATDLAAVLTGQKTKQAATSVWLAGTAHRRVELTLCLPVYCARNEGRPYRPRQTELARIPLLIC